jgi:hypothetical protein
MQVIPFWVLDLSPINQGSDAAQAFRNSLDATMQFRKLPGRRQLYAS